MNYKILLIAKVDLAFLNCYRGQSGTVKAAFVNKQVSLNGDLNLDDNGTSFTYSGVVLYEGWLFGNLTQLNDEGAMIKNNIALGFSTTDFVVHTNADLNLKTDHNEFTGSIYQKLSPKLESGIQMAWSTDSDTKFGIGASYELDPYSSIRAKINNQSLLGLGYQQRLREGVTLTLSALIDAKNMDGGGHKIGLALEFNT